MKVKQEDIFNHKYLEVTEVKLNDKKDKVMLTELEILKEKGIEYLYDFNFELPKLVKIPKDNGKFRDIFIYPTKSNLVLKLLAESLNDKFSEQVSDRVFSYKKGFRIFDAVKTVQKDMLDTIQFVKLDISNYFMEVGRDNVLDLIKECFEMDYLGTKLLEMFERDKYLYRSEECDGYLGLMPGSPLSCTLSNLMLRRLDTIMIGNTHSYTRYSDDIVIGCKTERDINTAVEILTETLKTYSLLVNPTKVEYFGNKNVEFLGLTVNTDKIDINEKKFKAIKSYIKKESKRLRKDVELNKINKETALKQMVSRNNSKMYKSILRDDLHIGMGGFVLSNISTMDTIREIDFYFINQCRYILTGKYNKANVKVLSIEQLEEMGYRSMCELFKLRCMDKQIYMNEVYTLL